MKYKTLTEQVKTQRGLFVVLAISVVGVVLLLSTHAATWVASFEAENGTLNSVATTDDATATNQHAVRFKDNSGTITSGTQMNATNTGLAGVGVSESSLTTVSGSIDYGTAYNGQTISGKLYTNKVTISGNNITIKNCKMNASDYDSGIYITGDHVTVKNCTITAPANKDLYEGIYINDTADSPTVSRNDISRGENLLTTYGSNVLISENYMHDTTAVSTGGHPDGIEVYGGANITITLNRIMELNEEDAPINVAPNTNAPQYVKNLTVSNNFLDGGQHIILLDVFQSGGPFPIQGTRILGNIMGGHQVYFAEGSSYGPYHALLNSNNGVTVVQTGTSLPPNVNNVLWPTSSGDPNVNYWGESQDLTPNKNGQIVLPAY